MKVLHIGIPVNGLINAFQKKSTSYHFLEWTDYLNSGNLNKLCDIISSIPSDLVFYHLQQPIDESIIKSSSGYKINWTWDYRNPTPSFYHTLAPLFNKTIFSSRCENVLYSDYLPPHVDTTYYDGIGTVLDTIPPIVFIGNNFDNRFDNSQDRILMVQTLKYVFDEQFGVYGHGWNSVEYLNDKMNYFFTLPVGQKLEKIIYNSTKIVINHNHFQADGYTSDRMMRAMSSGKAVVSSYIPNDIPYLENKYEHWKSLDELIYKVKYLLENDSYRNKLSYDGKLAVTENYSWDNFVDKIFNYVYEAK
jgi:glycosyltransferase involved in cell wall biosynthesis